MAAFLKVVLYVNRNANNCQFLTLAVKFWGLYLSKYMNVYEFILYDVNRYLIFHTQGL